MNAYINHNTLIPGTSYNDERGIEYLYIGRLTGVYINNHDNPYDHPTVYPGASRHCLKLSPAKIRELQKYDSLQAFLTARMNYAGKKQGFIFSGFTYAPRKNFVSVNTVYFDVNNSKIHDMTVKDVAHTWTLSSA